MQNSKLKFFKTISIVELYFKGTCLSFYNSSIQKYTISKWSVDCKFTKHAKKLIVNIFCQNEYQNGNYNITFNLPDQVNYSRKSIYALLSIIVLLLIIFYIKVKDSLRKLKYPTLEIEL
ncbi:unnamed protein product [Paramecium sonneborni]|uniref:Uncharacterized protein n=1 Tax=Paramecium sonneborni TaxID=65129 RepID=A0A8S1RMG3_9CILI|nr:unnamed protein product [Paramecium sonneborni]